MSTGNNCTSFLVQKRRVHPSFAQNISRFCLLIFQDLYPRLLFPQKMGIFLLIKAYICGVARVTPKECLHNMLFSFISSLGLIADHRSASNQNT